MSRFDQLKMGNLASNVNKNNTLFTISHAHTNSILKPDPEQTGDLERTSEFDATGSYLSRIKEKQRLSVPLAKFSREERVFMARRNFKKLEEKLKKNDINKNQTLVLPDNTKVRKTLLGDWSTHLHKRGQSFDTYNAFKRPVELNIPSLLPQSVLFRC